MLFYTVCGVTFQSPDHLAGEKKAGLALKILALICNGRTIEMGL